MGLNTLGPCLTRSLLACGGGQAVSVLAFYSIDLSSNPTEAYSFFSIKFVFENNENKQKRPGFAYIFIKKHYVNLALDVCIEKGAIPSLIFLYFFFSIQ